MSIVGTLIDKARARSGIASDSALAAHFGVHRQAVSKWRTGDAYPDEENIAHMATMAGDDPAEWLVAIKAVRSDGAAGKAWAALAKRMAATAALLAVMVFPALQTPAQAATDATETAQSRHYAKLLPGASPRPSAFGLIWRWLRV
ncbi:helix-turn-helix domain-containing protein [Pseudoxanthomonas putridarboris]|uniref:helix-turn-helix domain-containing protein n=1 Tax=Pseudoxanthomonas putridarboris TaxID=752605 RepID=UPI003CE52CE9